MSPTNKMIVQQVGCQGPTFNSRSSTQQLPAQPPPHSTPSVLWHVSGTAAATAPTHRHTPLPLSCGMCALLQARHLWAFSSLLMAKPETWGFKTSEVRAAADSAFKFMRDNMLRDVDGGENQAWLPSAPCSW